VNAGRSAFIQAAAGIKTAGIVVSRVPSPFDRGMG